MLEMHLCTKPFPLIPHLDFGQGDLAQLFMLKNAVFQSFFIVKTGLDLTSSHKMPNLVPM